MSAYAHIYKVPKSKTMKACYQLIVTMYPDISIPNSTVSDLRFDTKAEAKLCAKTAGAKPWNY